jgi:DnaJ like chaperone protein
LTHGRRSRYVGDTAEETGLSIWGRIRDGVAELKWSTLFGLDEPPARPAGEGGLAGVKQVGFTIAVIALGAKMATADGIVTDAEIRAFHEIFQAPPEERANVEFFFDLARRSTTGAETYARQAAKLLDGNRSVLEDLLGALFYIARADGSFAPQEDAYLQRVARAFGFNDADYRRIRAFHIASDDDPYLILGVATDADPAEIKARWRQLVRENHPDHAMAQGLPAEFVAISTAKLARINAAYDRLKPVLGPDEAS